LTGQDSYQPGFQIDIGWKFDDTAAVTFRWRYLSEAQYRAGATLAPPRGTYGPALADTFLFAPVFNFPPEYAGADFKVRPTSVTGLQTNLVNPQAVFGIWNGASIMTIDFVQRYQQYDITYRDQVFETEDYRLSGLMGPRLAWIWERFKWTTTSIGQDVNGFISDTGPDNVAIYTNITSNRMYGAFIGCEQEAYIGHGFSCMLRTEVAALIDSVKERAQYETANRFAGRPENKRAKRDWTFVPQFYGQAGMMWYPTEFIQLYLGYELNSFFNTLASRRPIDPDYSNLAPKWSHVNRYFDGFAANIALQF